MRKIIESCILENFNLQGLDVQINSFINNDKTEIWEPYGNLIIKKLHGNYRFIMIMLRYEPEDKKQCQHVWEAFIPGHPNGTMLLSTEAETRCSLCGFIPFKHSEQKLLTTPAI